MSTPTKADSDKLFEGLHPKVRDLQKEAQKRLRERDRTEWADTNLPKQPVTRYGK